MKEPIDIVILTYNRLAYFKKMLKSLCNNTDYPYRLIVVDNASDDRHMIEYLRLKHYDGFINKLIINDKNYILKGWHYGLSTISSPFFALSDPDIILPESRPCWLTQLVNSISRYSEIVRIGLSLDPQDVPECWTKKQGKRLCFQTGPVYKNDIPRCPSGGLLAKSSIATQRCDRDTIFSEKLCGERNIIAQGAAPFRITDIDTTMQIIRTDNFRNAGGFEFRELNIEFWKGFRKQGLTLAAQHLTAKHLGWYEYQDEPCYLKKKSAQIRYYPEVELIK